MTACARCSEQNQASARFCAACGAPLQAAVPASASARKTVTVLFCDVADSTELGERLDPESMRRVMARWFDAMRDVLERHGGTVEKFIGDAVMAVFGVPQLHEDDALRAARAAVEMRGALARLNEEIAPDFGFELHARIGINTGEVVAGDGSRGETLVTGDAVNTAKRLEQAARAGEILVGVATRGLVANAAVLEPREPLTAKGKRDPVEAFTLLAVIEGAPGDARRLDAPLIGRRTELAALREAFHEAVRERSCRLFTVFGPAGIGKSRLAAELGASIRGEALFLSGRCLPYGDGITFLPLRQIVREAGGPAAVARALGDEDDAPLVLERLRGAIAAGGAPGSAEETFWAVRRAFEALARNRPLVVCVEDIHWAEATFLDLLQYLAGWTADAPVLLLCLARAELLEEHPSWASGPQGSSLALAPLSEPESEQLLDALSVEWPLDMPARARVAEAAEGNPLYVEQLVAMLGESGEAAVADIPPTIHSLLAARLDRLDPGERAVLERAAVAGKEFWRSAVAELSPGDERDTVGARLLALVRRDMIVPEPSGSSRDDLFRFRHGLIRDAAYAGIPKEQRADLHERFAARLERNAGEHLAQVEELVGYHLEQAYGYRAQLGPLDEAARTIGERAGNALDRAAGRAHATDARSAALLLERATKLPASGARSVERLIELGAALRDAGDLVRSEHVFEEALAAAGAADDSAAQARARIESSFARLHTAEAGLEEIAAIADEAWPVLERAGDDAGVARALMLRLQIEFIRGRMTESRRLAEDALDRLEGRGEENAHFLRGALVREALRGPTPVDEAIARCEAIAHEGDGGPVFDAHFAGVVACLEAMRGRFGRARELAWQSRAILEDLGRPLGLVAARADSGVVEQLAGDPAAAVEHFAWACDLLRPLGERGLLPAVAGLLAHAHADSGAIDEALAAAALSRETALAEDVLAQVLWRTAHAKALARRGDAAAAEPIAREAVGLAQATDDVNLEADAESTLAEVLRALGRTVDAEAAGRRAFALYERKGNTAAAARLPAGPVRA